MLNIFKKSSNIDNYFESFDIDIKKWNEDFNYNLENDTAFENALNYNSSNYFLSKIFDKDIFENPNNFTNINKKLMYYYGHFTNTNLKKINNLIIQYGADMISKPFIRLVLKPNLSESDIHNLLYLLADSEFYIEVGGGKIFNIGKLLFIYLICEKLAKPIKLFNVKEFIDTYTQEEILNMIRTANETSCIINQKYFVSNINDNYLDIPLLIDFFSYNIPTLLISLSFHKVNYSLKIPENNIGAISEYISDIVIMFEEIHYGTSELRKSLYLNNFEFIKMDSRIDYFHNWYSNQLISIGYSFVKFIFVIIRPVEKTNLESNIINHIDHDIDISQLPQIINVSLEELDESKELNETTKITDIELDNIWVSQFDNMCIYGIAADGVNSMKNWINVLNEGVKNIEKIYNINKEYSTNINLSNIDPIYKIVNLNKLVLTFSESNVPINIEIIYICQNSYRIMYGMCGNSFNI